MTVLCDDIINHPHHVSRKHPQMSMHDRADIKKKLRKNAILKGTNLMGGVTMKERNNQIGGHKK